jgi:alpha-L-fucosidase 2
MKRLRTTTLFLLLLLNVSFGSLGLLAQPARPLVWHFPISRPHAGILLGNGTQGLMVWGADRTLNITVGRAGFWDHRGGNDFTAKTTYQDVKKLLQAGNYAGIKTAFATPKTGDQGFGHPQQLGGGRLEITLPDGWTLTRGELNMAMGEIVIVVSNSGKFSKITINQAVDDEETKVILPQSLIGKIKTKLVPAWMQTQQQMAQAGITPPVSESYTSGVTGLKTVINQGKKTQIVFNEIEQSFTQRLPLDGAIVMLCSTSADEIQVRTAKRPPVDSQNPELTDAVTFPPLINYSKKFWKDYWASVPQITLPDPALQEIVDYGLYKQACVSPPQGVAAALQGPFMEDYQIVPWSNDYHFNINVQMMYTPALATNRLSHFGPLWAMMRGWMPTLKQNGEAFFGRKGALMLPHAVDDRCRVVGTFWTGTIDHACTAWMAQMAWQHYRYALDQPDSARAVLHDMAWPLLVGAFEGYYAMLEEVTDSSANGGKRWSLPISVSPEYGGDGPKAWGRDASFQLAALHRICRILPEAARAMSQPIDPRWADVDRRLPAYTTVKGVYMTEWGLSNERIGLWQGTDLDGSHRHHSHLAGIYPFQTIDLNDPTQRKIVDNSLTTWRFRGAGGWSGWCVPWASILLSRTGQAEAAVNWLHFWKDNFTNEGRGTLHNANNNGTSLLGAPDWTREPKNREIMQLDGGFGALSAVLELLVQCRDDAVYVLPNLPRNWRDLRFDRIRTDGAFQIGATVADGKLTEIRVKSLAGGKLRLVSGFGDVYRVNGETQKNPVLERDCKIGEVLRITSL